MSTARSSRAGLVAGALVCSLLVACSPGGSDEPAAPDTMTLPSDTATPSTPSATRKPRRHRGRQLPPAVVADVAGAMQRVLDHRAGGLRTRDRDRFLSDLMPVVDLRDAEGGYFDNLAQLPLSDYDQRLIPSSLVRSGSAYWAVVETMMRLGPFDARAVRSLDRYRFVPWRRTTFRIAATTDPEWEAAHVGVQQPWDLEPIRARQGSGVVGVFDEGTRDRSAELVSAVERGLSDVSARVPYDWSRNVVFYALSDPSFLASFDNLPGGDPEALDAVAFTVPAGPDDAEVASTRFVLSPDALARADGPAGMAALDRLVRHELTHVAVGTHDDAAPVWLAEGIAEWLSVQSLPPEERQVPERALALARAGRVVMPDDASFNDADATVHYAVAWWVCEWIAQTFSEQNLWAFVDAFATLDDQDDAAVVRQVLKMSPDELAERGAQLMLATYEPEPSETPTSPATPSATGTPSDGPTTAG